MRTAAVWRRTGGQVAPVLLQDFVVATRASGFPAGRPQVLILYPRRATRASARSGAVSRQDNEACIVANASR